MRAAAGARAWSCAVGHGHLALLAAVGRGLAPAAQEERRRQRLAARGVAALGHCRAPHSCTASLGHRRAPHSVTAALQLHNG